MDAGVQNGLAGCPYCTPLSCSASQPFQKVTQNIVICPSLKVNSGVSRTPLPHPPMLGLHTTTSAGATGRGQKQDRQDNQPPHHITARLG